MGPTIKEKKFAITVTNQRLLIYISGQNARHLYNLKINNINNKTDFNDPTIISLLSGKREFSMQDKVGHVPNPSLRPWYMSMTLSVNDKSDNKIGFLSKLCVNYNILISFHFIKFLAFFSKNMCQLSGGLRPLIPQ